MTMWNLRTLADCVLNARQDRGINVGLARDLARAALKADTAMQDALNAILISACDKDGACVCECRGGCVRLAAINALTAQVRLNDD